MTVRKTLCEAAEGIFDGVLLGLALAAVLFVGAVVGVSVVVEKNPQCFEVTK